MPVISGPVSVNTRGATHVKLYHWGNHTVTPQGGATMTQDFYYVTTSTVGVDWYSGGGTANLYTVGSATDYYPATETLYKKTSS